MPTRLDRPLPLLKKWDRTDRTSSLRSNEQHEVLLRRRLVVEDIICASIDGSRRNALLFTLTVRTKQVLRPSFPPLVRTQAKATPEKGKEYPNKTSPLQCDEKVIIKTHDEILELSRSLFDTFDVLLAGDRGGPPALTREALGVGKNSIWRAVQRGTRKYMLSAKAASNASHQGFNATSSFNSTATAWSEPIQEGEERLDARKVLLNDFFKGVLTIGGEIVASSRAMQDFCAPQQSRAIKLPPIDVERANRGRTSDNIKAVNGPNSALPIVYALGGRDKRYLDVHSGPADLLHFGDKLTNNSNFPSMQERVTVPASAPCEKPFALRTSFNRSCASLIPDPGLREDVDVAGQTKFRADQGDNQADLPYAHDSSTVKERSGPPSDYMWDDSLVFAQPFEPISTSASILPDLSVDSIIGEPYPTIDTSSENRKLSGEGKCSSKPHTVMLARRHSSTGLPSELQDSTSDYGASGGPDDLHPITPGRPESQPDVPITIDATSSEDSNHNLHCGSQKREGQFSTFAAFARARKAGSKVYLDINPKHASSIALYRKRCSDYCQTETSQTQDACGNHDQIAHQVSRAMEEKMSIATALQNFDRYAVHGSNISSPFAFDDHMHSSPDAPSSPTFDQEELDGHVLCAVRIRPISGLQASTSSPTHGDHPYSRSRHECASPWPAWAEAEQHAVSDGECAHTREALDMYPLDD